MECVEFMGCLSLRCVHYEGCVCGELCVCVRCEHCGEWVCVEFCICVRFVPCGVREVCFK